MSRKINVDAAARAVAASIASSDPGEVGEKKFIGGFLSVPLVGHLSLLTAAYGVTRAELIEGFLVHLLSNGAKPDELVRRLAQKIIVKWESAALVAGGGKLSWAAFIEKEKRSLRRKKLFSEHIDAVLAEADRMRKDPKREANHIPKRI